MEKYANLSFFTEKCEAMIKISIFKKFKMIQKKCYEKL